MGTTEPRGVGVYTMALGDKWHGSPTAAAKKASDHGVSFVALLACWQDMRKKGKVGPMVFHHGDANRKDNALLRYAEAFNAQGIDVWLWGFPWAGAEERFIASMASATEMCPNLISGWLFDPELGYKWKGKNQSSLSMRGQPEALTNISMSGTKAVRSKQAKKLMELAVNAIGERLGLGVTSYGMAKYHPNFPWAEFGGYGFGSPQLYSVGPQQVDQGIQQWREHGWKTIIPSVPTFGNNDGEKLHNHLSSFVDGHEDISGFIFWVWRATSSKRGSAGRGVSEWDILARWADWLARGACALAPRP